MLDENRLLFMSKVAAETLSFHFYSKRREREKPQRVGCFLGGEGTPGVGQAGRRADRGRRRRSISRLQRKQFAKKGERGRFCPHRRRRSLLHLGLERGEGEGTRQFPLPLPRELSPLDFRGGRQTLREGEGGEKERWVR